MNSELIIKRVWAMPNKWTFTIPPIAKLLRKYVNNGDNWIDPFAGENSFAEITNDMNPKRSTTFNMEAIDFIKKLDGQYKGILLDPPYSLRQVKECYESIGVEFTKEDSQQGVRWSKLKNIITPKIQTGGYAISFGWNTTGFGKNRGFKPIEILIVNHGSGHNDTLCIVEQKIIYELFNNQKQ